MFRYEIKLAISAALESGQKTSGGTVAALPILNSSCASHGASKNVAALVIALIVNSFQIRLGLYCLVL